MLTFGRISLHVIMLFEHSDILHKYWIYVLYIVPKIISDLILRIEMLERMLKAKTKLEFLEFEILKQASREEKKTKQTN